MIVAQIHEEIPRKDEKGQKGSREIDVSATKANPSGFLQHRVEGLVTDNIRGLGPRR